MGDNHQRYGGERSPGPGHFGEEAGEASGSQENNEIILTGGIHWLDASVVTLLGHSKGRGDTETRRRGVK